VSDRVAGVNNDLPRGFSDLAGLATATDTSDIEDVGTVRLPFAVAVYPLRPFKIENPIVEASVVSSVASMTNKKGSLRTVDLLFAPPSKKVEVFNVPIFTPKEARPSATFANLHHTVVQHAFAKEASDYEEPLYSKGVSFEFTVVRIHFLLNSFLLY
jgi:hypothetical protein